MKNTFSISLIFLAIFLSQPLLVYAKASPTISDVNYESVNPNSMFYPIKRATEKVKLFFLSKIDPKKEEAYTLKLLNRRISELVYISDKKDLDNL